jgi:hypothetical protein
MRHSGTVRLAGLANEAGPNASPLERLDAALYQAACAVNTLRNRQGAGHGRPFLPTVTGSQVRIAVENHGHGCRAFAFCSEDGA